MTQKTLITPTALKSLIFIACATLIFCILLLTSPIAQDLSYHLLADNRQWLAIPNFSDVISNLPFAIIAVLGLKFCFRVKTEAHLSWLVFFTGLFLVAIGSSYYHLNPNNQTLVWDRLPIMLSLMGLFVALLIENISGLNEKWLLLITTLFAFSSVIYWHYTDDLRFYGLMQLIPLAAIPLVLFLYKSRYTHRHYLLYALACYLLAKVFEFSDQLIYELSGQFISGHTIKHCVAALATYYIYLMLKNRQLLDNN